MNLSSLKRRDDAESFHVPFRADNGLMLRSNVNDRLSALFLHCQQGFDIAAVVGQAGHFALAA